ncbi:MAG: ATPase [Tannerella sp.]|jgi:V/A-type H+-transporting ATPase subunit I|nr:ATPase [Tannerella sp.]
MIKKMRKYAFMIYHKEYNSFLTTLQDLGVVHIQETQSITHRTDLQDMISQRKRVETLIDMLKKINEASEKSEKDVVLAPAQPLQEKDGFKLVDTIEKSLEKRSELNGIKQVLLKDISYLEIWGDFSYERIDQLEKAGYEISFFSCPDSKFNNEWLEEYNAILINEYQSIKYFITITKEGTPINIDAEHAKLPDCGLSELKKQYDQLQEDIIRLEEHNKELAASNVNSLIEFDKSLQNDFNWANALAQTEHQADEKVMFLEGWIVEDQGEAMQKVLDKDGYFYRQLEIEEGENVPIELKNNFFTRLYEPITKMYSLPNYWEFDSTPLVAPFFMLFFGLCLGDAGYGLLVFIAATIFKRKMNDSYKPFAILFQYLGGAATVLGFMSGSFFGLSLVEVPFFQSIKDYFLSSDNLMTLSIVIGILHIIIAKTVAAFKKKEQKGFKYSMASFAWIFVIVALVCIFGLPMLNIHLPDILVYVLYGIAGVGILVAFLYNTPGKNVFMNFGSGLWDTYNMATGLLGDTLSYIRLFAIGLTGAVLGGVFNSLAVTMTETMSAVPRFIVMLLILLVGHGISFALCMISSLVHPIRLIFVEYFKNSDFEGGGKAYTPFKKI